MTFERIATSPASAPTSTRDFDYGVGDDRRQLEEQIRCEIAARIRRSARLDPLASGPDRQAYERAALIAEGLL